MSDFYENTENHISKKRIFCMVVILLAMVIATIYFGVISRFAFAAKYRDYAQTMGVVQSLQRYESEDSDGDVSYYYSAKVGYVVDGSEYFFETGEIFDKYSVPNQGESISVIYNREDPSENYAATWDWMTKATIPAGNYFDNRLFGGGIVIGMAMVMMGLPVKNEKTRIAFVVGGILFIAVVAIARIVIFF